MAEFSLQVTIKKDGRWYVISDKQFGIATQGKTVKEAILNFYEAFELCYEDSDWRKLHNISLDEQLKTPDDAPQKVDVFGKISTSLWQRVNSDFLQTL